MLYMKHNKSVYRGFPLVFLSLKDISKFSFKIGLNIYFYILAHILVVICFIIFDHKCYGIYPTDLPFYLFMSTL